ncbi:tetratricopeptide (TPR) repeat protein [Saccharothrix ecbatanensis]|uniref:Tetratricopeptide (TPR) repeat protein n=1 Tax=Saccharothrix ecbatanensis TaxID=1105145 RepID=A0A7W9HVT3_9PSEU|nr:tetratricopeptide repeat protein [Saccharothrix ecbatanensis]MBB5808929.1 tetratricopeptide (TPR) repeat protein [Saccharothrix ecbatanensis]
MTDVGNSVVDVSGPVVQAGSVGGNVVINHHPASPVEVPDQLPPPTAGFVNRVREFEALDGVLAAAGARPSGCAVVTGLAGVGKSALVHTWAAGRSERFPDGRMYIDFTALRTPGGTAVGDALAECLRALGVHEEHIPPTLAGRTALFRTKMATGRRLVVLDDVTEPAHVQPFLTRSTGSVVVATSNERLVELALDGATAVPLAPLGLEDAVRVLAALCPDGRLDADQTSAEALVRLCGGLPVALRVAAGRLLGRPHLTPAALVDQLSDEAGRLEGLALGGERVVSAVFDNSYRSLHPAAAALYRRLGLLPLLEIPRHVIDVVAVRADDAVEALVRAHLLDEIGPDRYAFHGLVALHARGRAAEEETAGDADRLLATVLGHYLERLCHADRTVMEDRLRIAAVAPSTPTPFGDKRQALEWLVTERANLLGLVRSAELRGYDEVAWQMAEALTALYLNRRYVADWIESADIGARAARRVGDPAAEARLRSVVSRAYTDLGRLDRAEEELALARELAARSDNPVLVASVWEFTGRYLDHVDPHEAIAAYRNALAVNSDIGERRGAALATYFMGCSLHATGEDDEALAALSHAHAEFEAVDDPRMAARALIGLGALRRDVGDFAAAREDLETSVALFQQSGAEHYESQALVVLADVLEAQGQDNLAREHLARALTIREAAGADVSDLRARLGE